MTQSQVYEKVATTLKEALNVDDEDIRPEATLQGDLGAESIDFLDITFRLEREFNIKIPRSELFPESIFNGDPQFVQGGTVTSQGLEELRTKVPHVDLSDFQKDPQVGRIGDLFTVGSLTRYIHSKVANN